MTERERMIEEAVRAYYKRINTPICNLSVHGMPPGFYESEADREKWYSRIVNGVRAEFRRLSEGSDGR